jgi:hypothetical protein
MIKLSLCLPYEDWRIVAPINLQKGDVVLCEFEHKKNQYNQMNITFTPEFSRFQQIRNSKNWGVRLQTESQDLGFVYYDGAERPFGVLECKLMSGAYLLQGAFLDNKDRYYEGSLATFLSQLSSDFNFTPISGDKQIKLVTGALDALTTMDEAIKYPDFYEWIDAGITGDGKVDIVYGDFRKIEDYYLAEDDERFKPVRISNYSNLDNSNDNSIIYIEDYKISKQYERPTLLYPYVNNGTGSAPNTRTELTTTNPSWLNPNFPIVERISPITNIVTRYIRNPFADNYRERVQVYVLNNTSNTEDVDGNVDVQNQVSEELMYRRAIWYIQAMNNFDTYNINPIIKKIILAGTLAKMDFVSNTIKLDGSTYNNVSIIDNKIVDNLNYNLDTIYD